MIFQKKVSFLRLRGTHFNYVSNEFNTVYGEFRSKISRLIRLVQLVFPKLGAVKSEEIVSVILYRK